MHCLHMGHLPAGGNFECVVLSVLSNTGSPGFMIAMHSMKPYCKPKYCIPNPFLPIVDSDGVPAHCQRLRYIQLE